jgi:diguanylate cyclase (GGDEF)-like protein
MAWIAAPRGRTRDIAAPRHVARIRRAYLAVAALGISIHAAGALAGQSPWISDWLYCSLYLLAATACAYRARSGDARGAWATAAVGVLVWGGAEITFRVLQANPHDWYPRTAQTMLFVAFALAYTTLVLLARERVRRFDVVLALDGLLAGLAAAAAAALLLFPALEPHPTHLSAMPAQLFLVSALVGLVFVVTVIGMTGWRPGPAWALIATAITINVAGDAVLVHLTDAQAFHRGSLADTLFATSALLLGLASFYPSRHAAPSRDTPWRLAVPLVSATAALGVLIAAVAQDAGWLAAGLAAGALAVVSARMSIALELLERSRSQALADELTGLGNRRRLVRDLERRLAPAAGSKPFTLLLLDLDGFKRYNDTFGHPSGDALLARLADRLARAVWPGVAYRMGGDEFCAILEAEELWTGAALEHLRDALSEHGEAFSITSTVGAVACPSEAADATSALGIADRRMYDRKAGRATEQLQARDTLLKILHERDPELHDHMRSVAALAVRIARRLGLDEAATRQVARAAELHDIGRLAVPDDILSKPGALSPGERRFIRQYPIVGARILRAAPSLAPAALLVRATHERWDGHGYPDGLVGAATPLGARIIAACDAYQAMRSSRPYHEPRTIAEALAELRRCAGTQFDPGVVDALGAELSDSILSVEPA